ncbi:MAG: TolB family protein, partial [Pyrinomonadaceae bacterium]
MKRFLARTSLALMLAALAFVNATAVHAQPARPLTIDDLLKVRRVGDPQLSPDGRQIAYTISDPDKTANRSRTQIYLISVSGGEPKQLTSGAASAAAPRWSPDGKRLAYTTGGQIHVMDVASGQSKQVTNISTGAGDPVWSPDGKLIAFVSDIYPDCADDACNQKRDAAMEEGKVKAK